jgi:hypothetical protein
MLVGESNSLFAFVQETKQIIATGKNHAKNVKPARIFGKFVLQKKKIKINFFGLRKKINYIKFKLKKYE